MNKRTKIIATVGPATESAETIEKLINKGVNVFRFNTKHNTIYWHKEKIKLVQTVSNKLNKNIAILVDLQGPDVRIGVLSRQELDLKEKDIIYLENVIKKNISIQLSKKYIKDIHKGQEIIIDDGRIVLKAVSVDHVDNVIKAEVLQGDLLQERKGVFFPGLKIDQKALTKQDKQFIKLAVDLKCEFLALSFVRDTADIKYLKKYINKYSGDLQVVSKIETLEAVKNIDSIVDATDAIMVARGDLGVEMYLEAVPIIQKKLIKKCIKEAKPVIVATQMLKSMIINAHPTRAEISDIANASFDSADAVMLSEESAIGKFPAKAVSYMAKTLKYNELESPLTHMESTLNINTRTKAIVSSADNLQLNLTQAGINPKAFIILTESGKTAIELSAARPNLPIFAFTQKETSARKLALSWGVESYVVKFEKSIDESLKKVNRLLIKRGLVEKGDSAIVISGQNIGVEGQTDSIRVIEF